MASRAESKTRNLAGVAPLTATQRRALAWLAKDRLLDGLYLAGGVAVAHYLGHRQSRDLDLFSSQADFDLDVLRDNAVSVLKAQVVAQSDVTLTLRVGEAMIDVVRYPYHTLVRTGSGPEGVPIASLRDLAVMKLAAIAKRGVRRDYWDVYEIFTRTRLTLRRTCDDYISKFGVAESDLYHVLRALNWFEEADAETKLPRGLTKKHWERVRAWFEVNAPRELARRAS